MAVLRQIQTFLLAQHSHGPIGLQECILRALLGVCQVSAFFAVFTHVLCGRVQMDAQYRLWGRLRSAFFAFNRIEAD